MVYLHDLMDESLLDEMINEGYVTARAHDSLPLTILNYTAKAQYEWVWNEVTLQCRGLIYEGRTHRIVARPFPKFFNWDQGQKYPPTGPVVRMDKMDGSLGILYRTSDDYAIATRGSFHSEQAAWATEFYQSYIEDLAFMNVKTEFFFDPLPNKTYLFEIVYPENRIVVDYGEYKGLVLIDVIDNETGYSDLQEFDDCAWPDKVTRVSMGGFDSGDVVDIADGNEGFVYLWPERNYRTKMKSAQYVELHKLISHLSEKSVWEALMAGKTLDQIKAGLPDEFYGFIDKVYTEISDNALSIVFEVQEAFASVRNKIDKQLARHEIPRKEFALAIKDHPLKKYLFLALDGKPIYPVALAASKPKTDKSLVNAEDI